MCKCQWSSWCVSYNLIKTLTGKYWKHLNPPGWVLLYDSSNKKSSETFLHIIGLVTNSNSFQWISTSNTLKSRQYQNMEQYLLQNTETGKLLKYIHPFKLHLSSKSIILKMQQEMAKRWQSPRKEGETVLRLLVKI